MLRSLSSALWRSHVCRSDVVCFLRNVGTTSRLWTEFKLKDHLRNCYSILNVSEDCSMEELKAAYLEKAKIYHPDSNSTAADAKKFSLLQEAFKAIVEHRKGTEENELVTEEDMEPSIWNPRHKIPQHRQYLTFEGVGTGTPFERQKIYEKYRVARATEAVLEHKIHQLAVKEEDALVLKDKQKARKHKISNAIDRLVEDLIQEAMQRGDFKDLPGSGRPLDDTDRNPLVDSCTHNLNKILINNGYAPEWITLQGDIRQSIHWERERLATVMKQVGQPPLSLENARKLQKQKENFSSALQDLNQKIDKFNIIVPFMNQQMIRFDPVRQIRKVQENLEAYLPKDIPKPEEEPVSSAFPKDYKMTVDSARIEWRDVWKHIREVFKS